MPDEVEKCLRVLGLAAGATEQAIKEAHRDLVKVWHPDRFGNDDRLRAKAQEKLKELNAAFDRLRGYRPPNPAAAAASEPRQPRVDVSEPVDVTVSRTSWRPAATVLASAAVGIVGVWLLLLSNRPSVQELPRASGTSETPPAPPEAPRTAVAPHSVKREPAAPESAAAATPRNSPDAPTTGSLRVDSQPVGARVSFDGAIVGETPVVVTDITPGEHQIGLDLDRTGYQPWSSSVVVVAGRVERVLAVMTSNATRR